MSVYLDFFVSGPALTLKSIFQSKLRHMLSVHKLTQNYWSWECLCGFYRFYNYIHSEICMRVSTDLRLWVGVFLSKTLPIIKIRPSYSLSCLKLLQKRMGVFSRGSQKILLSLIILSFPSKLIPYFTFLNCPFFSLQINPVFCLIETGYCDKEQRKNTLFNMEAMYRHNFRPLEKRMPELLSAQLEQNTQNVDSAL